MEGQRSFTLNSELRDEEDSLCLLQSGVGNTCPLNGLVIVLIVKSVTEDMN